MFLQTLCLSPKSVKRRLSLLWHIIEEISILTKNGIWVRKLLLFNLFNSFFTYAMAPSQNRRLWSQIREMRPIVGRFGLHRWLGKRVCYLPIRIIRATVGQNNSRQWCRICKKSLRKNETLTSWTLLAHFFPDQQNPYFKGQIISECPYEIIVSPKRPTKNFRDFCPSL